MENLKKLRKKKRLTQEELAKRLGISRLMVNQYENGKSMPGRHTLVKMAEFFNCTLDYLCGDNYETDHNTFDKGVGMAELTKKEEQQLSDYEIMIEKIIKITLKTCCELLSELQKGE